LEAIFLAGLTGALAFVAYAPFYSHYNALVGGPTGTIISRYLGLVKGGSELQPWLIVWAAYLFMAYSFVLVCLFHRPGPPARAAVALVLGAIGVAVCMVMLGRPTAALAALPLIPAVGLLFRRTLPGRDAMVVLLLALGLSILVGTELVYLRDFLDGGDWYRMNTLFKFGIPAWLVLGLAGAVALPRVWHALRDEPGLSFAWPVVALGLVATGLVFVPLGVQARVDDRFPGARPAIGTLDGTQYMTVGRYLWPDEQHVIYTADDYLAIHWLLKNVTGTPVVAEAPAGEYQVDGQPVGYDYYRAGGLRVASLTGFPSFVGQHENEQRPADQVAERTLIGQEFFQTTDPTRAQRIIEDLHVDYIYVGLLERLLFSPESLAKFDRMVAQDQLQVAYRQPGVTVYRVVSAVPGG